MTRTLIALGLSVLITSALPAASVAQTSKKQASSKTTISRSASKKTVKIVNRRTSPAVSIDVRNASLKQALARLFYASKVDFVFEGDMPTGLVTAKIQNQPFETALRLILESSDVPLTYQRTGNIYLIRALRPRPVNRNVYVASNPAPVTYVDDGWGNSVPVYPPNATAPATVGFQVGPNGVYPKPNTGGLQFGPPIGGSPVTFAPFGYPNPYGFGYPTVITNTGFNGGFGFPFNNGFGGSGLFFGNP